MHYQSSKICKLQLTLVHSIQKYDVLESQQTSKLQNRRTLFDVARYIIMHAQIISLYIFIKYYSSWLYVSSQLSLMDDYFIITITLAIPHGQLYFIIRKYQKIHACINPRLAGKTIVFPNVKYLKCKVVVMVTRYNFLRIFLQANNFAYANNFAQYNKKCIIVRINFLVILKDIIVPINLTMQGADNI